MTASPAEGTDPRFLRHQQRFAALASSEVTAALSAQDEPDLQHALQHGGGVQQSGGRPSRQSRIGEDRQGLSVEDAIAALYTSPFFWDLCREVFPNNNVHTLTEDRREGAPQMYPDWLLFLVVCVAGTSHHRTIRSAVRHFSSRRTWRQFAQEVHAYVPRDMSAPHDLLGKRRPVQPRPMAGDPATPLPVDHHGPVVHPQQRQTLNRRRQQNRDREHALIDGPCRWHVEYFVKRFRGLGIKNEPYPPGHRYHGMADRALDVFTKVSARQAVAMGLFNPDARLSYANPDRNLFIGADGSVFTTANGGENASSDLHATGNRDAKGRPRLVQGSKYTILSARVDGQYHSRVILGFAHTHKSHPGSARGEARAILDLLPVINRHAGGGIRGLLADSAVRGTAVTELQRDHGIIVVNYCHAEKNPGAAITRLHPDRVERSKLRWVVSHTNGLGRHCEHPIFANGGEFLELRTTHDGTDIASALEVISYETREQNGKHRERLEVRIHCTYSDPFTTKVPLFHDNPVSDAPRGQNWGEVVRVWAPGSPQFKHLYGARNDTEARHHDLKSRLAHLPGDVPGQVLRLLGASMAINAAGYQVHLQAHGRPNVLDDTA